ncbi:MAG: serine hydrolase [Acidimicrobiales bacterium]
MAKTAEIATSLAPSRSAVGEREVFLDVLRAIAIVRVIAWHAFGVAAITYFVAAMPAMFFVSGSLLAKSFQRRRSKTVLFDRFRRLLIPLWAFGLVAWVAMALVALWSNDELPLHQALAWVFPLTDPKGTVWEGGWLSSHLWYLRTLVWLFLASPLLLGAVRASRTLAFGVPIVAVFALDVVSRSRDVFDLGHATTWAVGDVALYSVFFMAGFLHRDGAFRFVSRRGWLAVALVAAAAAACWRLTQPVPLGVVNNSHPLHLFVGAGWLAAALAVQGTLGRLGSRPLIGACVRTIGRRSLTIYLWHTAAIIIAVNILEARHIDEPVAHAIGLVLLTAVGIVVATRLFGWIEDVAAGRRKSAPRAVVTSVPGPAPAPRPSRPKPAVPADAFAIHRRLALAAVVLLTAGLLATSASRHAVTPEAEAAARPARRPPIPSKPPPPPVFRSDDAAQLQSPEAEDRLVAGLDALVKEWAERTGVRGALLGVAVGPDIRWTAAPGTRGDTNVRATVRDRIDLASLTKLYTATLVHQAADAGLVEFDGPLPYLPDLPDFPYEEGITVTQLLDHTSGILAYRDTPEYIDNWALIDSPLVAIRASLAAPRLSLPGMEYNYSSTNYLLLGLMLEEVTGRSLDALFHDALFTPLDLRETVHRGPVAGEPRGGTAGIETSMRDLLTTGISILRDRRGLSDEAYAHMTTIDPFTGFGPGTFGFCPCRIDDDGVPQYFAIGYFGATAVLVYAPALDMTIAVDLIDVPPDSETGPVAVFFEMVEELARRS